MHTCTMESLFSWLFLPGLKLLKPSFSPAVCHCPLTSSSPRAVIRDFCLDLLTVHFVALEKSLTLPESPVFIRLSQEL